MSVNKFFSCVCLLFLLTTGCKETNAESKNLNLAPLTIENPDGRKIDFKIEMASTPEQQQKGLMFREQMPDNQGMVFIFDPPRQAAFWMKNTLIPLDMIFIAPDNRIHRIHRNARPHDLRSIPSNGITKAVLEINGGMSDKLGIFEGAKVILPQD